jgi:hypothetical protein
MKYFLITILSLVLTNGYAQKRIETQKDPVKQDLDFRPYAVRLYLVHFLPTVNPALLKWETTVVWHKYPTDWTEIEQLVVLPAFIKRRNYRICKDCPLEVVPILPE